jgi:hypothetical protein
MVDALDECDSGLSQLLKLIAHTSEPSFRVKWLVSSRNRADIETQLKPDRLHLKISLELNSSHISHAVNAFIDFKVAKLAEENGYDNELREEVSSYLRRNAEGTFLWVALACKGLRNVPVWETLQILKEFPPGLEPFYSRMMEQIRHQRSMTVEYCLKILSTATIIFHPLHLKELIAIADLPEKPFRDMRLLDKLVSLCGSFLTIREDMIYFVHQSAKDYFYAGKGSEIYPLGQVEEHRKITSRCLQVMSDTLKRDICGLRMPDASLHEAGDFNQDPLTRIRYACQYWTTHLEHLKELQQDTSNLHNHDQVYIFLKEHLHHWLEALSLMGKTSLGVLMIIQLEGLIVSKARRCIIFWDANAVEQPKPSELYALVYNARRFILKNRSVIELTPLQIYSSALLFSPQASITRNLFQKEIDWVRISSGLEQNWSPLLQTLEGHSQSVNSVVFSPWEQIGVRITRQ